MLPVFVKARVLSEVIPEGRAHIIHGTSNYDRNQGNETSMRKLRLAKGLSKAERMVILFVIGCIKERVMLDFDFL